MTDSGTPASRTMYSSLNGLRFFLAIWIAYFHVGHMFDADGFGALPILRMGVARVDVFFVLSGFVLSHVYWATRTKPFDYADFMAARLARIYPMYLIALALIGLYLTAGAVLGKAPDAPYPLGDLVKCLLFLQAFGLTETNAWNFPAWAVAAEMGGYLAFPLFILVASRLKFSPWAVLALAIGLLAAAEIFMRTVFAMPLNAATTDWGALRGAAMMFCGVGARAALEGFRTSSRLAAATAFLGAATVVTAALNQLGEPVVGLGAAFLMMGLARIDANGGRTFLSHPLTVRLGDWSYVIFILHAPIYTIIVQGLSVIGAPFVANAWTSLAMVCVVVAIAAPVHYLIEKPVREWIRSRWETLRGRRIARAGL